MNSVDKARQDAIRLAEQNRKLQIDRQATDAVRKAAEAAYKLAQDKKNQEKKR